jgi:hypothetical protein
MQLLKKVTAALLRGFRAIFPTCRDATRLQSEALDTRLSLAKRIGLRFHLLICNWCRRYGKQVRFLRNAAHDHPERLAEATSQKLSDEARQRIKEKLRSQGPPTAP